MEDRQCVVMAIASCFLSRRKIGTGLSDKWPERHKYMELESRFNWHQDSESLAVNV